MIYFEDFWRSIKRNKLQCALMEKINIDITGWISILDHIHVLLPLFRSDLP
jgi:hypothetical protein